MGRMRFDSKGKLVAVDGKTTLDIFDGEKKGVKPKEDNSWNLDSDEDLDEEHGEYRSEKLRKSEDLEFLKDVDKEESDEVKDSKKEDIFEKSYWNLFSKDQKLEPLRFSNGKTQEDVVKEIVSLIGNGKKLIFLHGACGTGKSAIALNIARVIGKASVVVPVKALQRQYEADYMGDKYLKKGNGDRLKIAMITGRDNHDSLFLPGKSCADPELPENIKIVDKNFDKLKEYYDQNTIIGNKHDFGQDEIEKMRRMAIAPTNPYWSPILPSDFEARQLKDAKKMRYAGCDGKEYTFYHRRSGCSYYDQFIAYKKADVIIFNAAKYNSEISIGRKPDTEVEIIDEADDYLDSLFVQESLNLSRFKKAIRLVFPESLEAKEKIDEIIRLIELEEKRISALGFDESQILKVSESKVGDIIKALNSNSELQAEIALDEMNYSNKALDVARNFSKILGESYLTYKKDEDNLYVKLVSTNLSGKLQELMDKTKTIVFMSGTLHSAEVLKKVFSMQDFVVVEAETSNFGNVDIVRTGKEFDCKYSTFSSKLKSREDYLKALEECIERAKGQTLVHVNAFQDLPSEEEVSENFLVGLQSSGSLKSMQEGDKNGKAIEDFKQGKTTKLFTTKCSRGVDFPGKKCESMVFTKYPNPNIQDTFWKVLKNNHPDFFWDFYKDKARREFLQRMFRALRSKKDHVYVLSPDMRVLNAVMEFQKGNS